MWKKAAALLLAGLGLQLGLGSSPGNASEYADTPTEIADGVHIPQKVTLLEETPYYFIPNALLNKAEGSFAPQTVEVIEAEVNWATSPNWWKIHTDFGDRWIKTAPYQIEVPPPPKISLMTETQLYAKPSEESVLPAALSPQDVDVVYAEKAWFKQTDGDYNPMRWIQIHTTWLGDVWIHLHLDQIGTFQTMDQTAYYAYVGYNRSPHMDYETYPTDGSQTQQFLHEIGQFRSVLGSVYQVETDSGTKWTPVAGVPVVAETNTINRSLQSPLYTYPSPYEDDPVLVPPGELRVIEKLSSDPYYGIGGPWYHVQSDRGEGWFNPVYADPEDATAEHAAIQLHMNTTTLYRYPNTGIILNHGQIGPQTVHPVSGWTDPNGIRWYQIDSFVGKAWIHVEPYEDRIVLDGRESDMQIAGRTSYQGAFYKNDEGAYTFGSETMGYEMEGQPYFSASFLARLYNYDLTEPDAEGWWTLKYESGYAFQIKAGEPAARTLWKGQIVDTIPLTGPLSSRDNKDAPLLGLSDLRALFGASTSVSPDNEEVILSARQYDLEKIQPPMALDGNRVHLSSLLYDETNRDPNAKIQALSITIIERGSNGSPISVSPPSSKLMYNLSYDRGLYDVTLDKALEPGCAQVTTAFKVGERILAMQDWKVTSSAESH